MTASRLSQPPRTPPAWVSSNSRSGIPMASSTLHGFMTWPEMQNSLVPVLFGRPMAANQAGPRRRISGTAAIDSTLLTVVGASIEPDIGGEWRLEPRLALLAFQAFEQRGFFAADI